MISLRLDVTKLEKARFYKGKKGIYCDLVLFDKPNEYGDDGFITQSLTKEERDEGERAPIVGNWRTLGAAKKNGESASQDKPNKPKKEADPAEGDIPF